jgi:probable F420-dependent oxidoreductase
VKIGKLGIWALTHEFGAADAASFARRVEAWGYSTLWTPEAFGRDPMVGSSWLLANTTRLQVATGIANIYARDPLAALNTQYGLAEQSAGRFLLGLGVSHAPLVEGLRGHRYEQPIPAMRAYLEAVGRARYQGSQPPERPLTVIAALGPRMLELAGSLADGAHPYNVTPEHTARAREILGPDKLLCPEQMVLLETDPVKAREIGRRVLRHSLDMPNYRASFQRMGFSEADLAGGGSDRLVDAIVAWGDEAAIRARIQQHWDAGADQVCIQCLPRQGMRLSREDEQIFELLAPAADAGGRW